MVKTNNKKLLSLLAVLCTISCGVFSQAKSGMESYNLLSQGKNYVWMPVIHYQTEKGFYTELRYNYEDVQTLSLFAGKTFFTDNELGCTVTPMLGFSTGNFSGASVAVNAEADWKNFYLSTQTQYSAATKKGVSDFFFSWSELGYNFSRSLFAGVALQYTRQEGVSYKEPGIVAGVSFKNFSLPFYFFKPFQAGQYIIVGLNFEYSLKKKNKS